MMSKSLSFYITYAILVVCALSTNYLLCQAQKEVIETDKFGLTIPNPLGDKPLFETNNQNGRLIAFHVPVLLDVRTIFRGGLDLKFEVNILSGLLHVNWDRIKLQDGLRHGPIQLSILGISLYDNKQQPYA